MGRSTLPFRCGYVVDIGINTNKGVRPFFSTDPFVSVPLLNCSELDIKHFDRHGFTADYSLLPAMMEVSFTFPLSMNFTGLAVLCGPKSSRITIKTDHESEFMAYDTHCYYERMMVLQFDHGYTDRFTIRLSPEIPDIELVKSMNSNN